MPLGTEVGLGPGHIVLDEIPVPPRKGAHEPPKLGDVLDGELGPHLTQCDVNPGLPLHQVTS